MRTRPSKPKAKGTISKATRLRMQRVWWLLRRSGLTFREVAEMAQRPEATIREGVRAFEVHMTTLDDEARVKVVNRTNWEDVP
jgi:hypothetical protein